MQDLQPLIQLCIRGDRSGQERLYQLYCRQMMVVCMRYTKTREEAEEVLQEGFMRVFEYLHQFKNEGSFEGWIRKIMVNCALRRYRSRQQLHAIVNIDETAADIPADETISAGLGAKELLQLVQQLPAAYRMVFNLYVFEGMKHREIAELLGISEGTSKSNLSDARNWLQKAVLQQNKIAKLKSV